MWPSHKHTTIGDTVCHVHNVTATLYALCSVRYEVGRGVHEVMNKYVSLGTWQPSVCMHRPVIFLCFQKLQVSMNDRNFLKAAYQNMVACETQYFFADHTSLLNSIICLFVRVTRPIDSQGHSQPLNTISIYHFKNNASMGQTLKQHAEGTQYGIPLGHIIHVRSTVPSASCEG